MRRLAWIAAALWLGGCNMVVTNAPVFSRADGAGAPRLRPGIWNNTSDPHCVFDERAPTTTWPDCADGGVVTAETITGHENVSGQRAEASIDYVLAAGDPRVLQLHGLPISPGSTLMLANYFYVALRPTATDTQGRITAYKAWLVLCGPPPPSKLAGSTNAASIPLGTLHPLPGLTMDQAKQNCFTASPAALRAAAAASEAWDSTPSSGHWVRDGDR